MFSLIERTSSTLLLDDLTTIAPMLRKCSLINASLYRVKKPATTLMSDCTTDPC